MSFTARPGDKLKLIACEIIFREACYYASQSPFIIDVEFLPKGLHDLKTEQMRGRLQDVVDEASNDDYKAILLGYARCNDGLVGVQARSVPLIIPKAHDCITFFLGGRKEYSNYFHANPGTYFHTTGWMERDNGDFSSQPGVMSDLGLNLSYAEMIEKYGEDNADFIREMLGDWKKHYKRLCYVKLGLQDETPWIERSKAYAEENNWDFECRAGNPALLARLILGPWDKEFLVVQPGQTITARNDDEVLGIGN